MIKKIIILSCVVALTSGCSKRVKETKTPTAQSSYSSQNTPKEPVIISQDAPKGCEYKGEIYGKAKSEWDVEVATRGARDSLKKQASKIGANYVDIQDTTSGKVMG